MALGKVAKQGEKKSGDSASAAEQPKTREQEAAGNGNAKKRRTEFSKFAGEKASAEEAHPLQKIGTSVKKTVAYLERMHVEAKRLRAANVATATVAVASAAALPLAVHAWWTSHTPPATLNDAALDLMVLGFIYAVTLGIAYGALFIERGMGKEFAFNQMMAVTHVEVPRITRAEKEAKALFDSSTDIAEKGALNRVKNNLGEWIKPLEYVEKRAAMFTNNLEFDVIAGGVWMLSGITTLASPLYGAALFACGAFVIGLRLLDERRTCAKLGDAVDGGRQVQERIETDLRALRGETAGDVSRK